MGETVYVPAAHRVEDLELLHGLMEEFAFAELVTAEGGVRITHLPVWLDRGAGRLGTLYGHVARQNPQQGLMDGAHSGVVVFRGPHSYISPSWYAKTGAVPTWNFAAVHAGGRLRPVTERGRLRELLARLTAKFEGEVDPAYDFSKADERVIDGLMNGITGFAMEIETLEGKFKFGQERSAADRASLLERLRTAPGERSLFSMTEEFYLRRGIL